MVCVVPWCQVFSVTVLLTARINGSKLHSEQDIKARYKRMGISERHQFSPLCFPLPFRFQLRQQHRQFLTHLRLHYNNSCYRTCLWRGQEGSAMPLHSSAWQHILSKSNCLTDHTGVTTAQKPQPPLLPHITFQITQSTEKECRPQSKPRVIPGKP